MKHEFVTYEQALALKELGFDEPCFAFYRKERIYLTQDFVNPNIEKQSVISAPLKQQVFRWFREKYGLSGWINEAFTLQDRQGVISIKSDVATQYLKSHCTTKICASYEEAESACIDKLIELVKNK